MEDGLVRINTFHAHRFDPTAAQTEDICVEDIAHALSLLCRANGHLRHFYSVGQHSLACQREAAARGWTPRVQLLVSPARRLRGLYRRPDPAAEASPACL